MNPFQQNTISSNLVPLANTNKFKKSKPPGPQKSSIAWPSDQFKEILNKQRQIQPINKLPKMEQQMERLKFLQNKLNSKLKLTAKQKKMMAFLMKEQKKYAALKQEQGQKEKIVVDLTDDTAPPKPVWKPIGAEKKPNTNQPQSSLGKSFEIFKAQLEGKVFDLTNEEPKMNPNAKSQDPKQTDQIWNLKPETNKHSQIRWELNPVDENDATKKDVAVVVHNEKDKPKEEAVPAKATSQVKLSILNKKPNVVAETVTSQLKLSVLNKKPTVVAENVASGKDPEVFYILNGKKVSSAPNPVVPVHRNKMPVHHINNMMPTTSARCGLPSGVPRSFLANQHNVGAIQPQPENSNIPEPYLPINQRSQLNLHIKTDIQTDFPQQYSPSDAYNADGMSLEHVSQAVESHDDMTGQKRQSAFDRLGPLSQTKKPKLTINLMCNKDESVREVVDVTDIEEKYTPVHLRADMADSSDDVVMKYLPLWPWKRNHALRKTVTARSSKSVMLMEQEQMAEVYEKDNDFILVNIKGYPSKWTKEQVLDTVLEKLKGKNFMPCFIEFTQQECKFLVLRSLAALLMIHKLGFFIHKDDVELRISISQVQLGLNQIDFIPRLVLRKLLAREYDGERKLSLSEFTTKPDISHFIYFPLNRLTNQTELVQLQSAVAWDYLTDLDLSRNRLTTIDGFDLPTTTQKLKHLNLSFNCLERITALLPCRNMALHSLKLEGNPLCHDYIDPDYYVRVLKMIFPCLVEIDGIPITLRGDPPSLRKNYCPPEAKDLVEKFLETYYPILDSPLVEDRMRIEELYDEKAVMTVTYKYKIRHSHLYRYYRNLFLRARVLDEDELDSVTGAASITKLICKWPPMEHDPYSFTIDVLHHGDFSTIIRIGGILKLTSDTLAEDEQMMAFTKTLVLMSKNGVEYKIQNEMLYWEEPSKEYADTAFKINSVAGSNRPSLKLESAPDEYIKEKLSEIFMKITALDKKRSEKCLELKEWNLKFALEYFMKLMKLDGLDSLGKHELSFK